MTTTTVPADFTIPTASVTTMPVTPVVQPNPPVVLSEQPATPVTCDIDIKYIDKNGLKIWLVRDMTKGKKGDDGTAYWNLPSGAKLAGLTDTEQTAIVKYDSDAPSPESLAAYRKVLDMYCTLLGIDKVIDYMTGRLEVALRTSQLEAGKDVFTMDEKYTKVTSYITDGDFGRERRGGISAMVEKLKVAANEKDMLKSMVDLLMRNATETDPVKKVALLTEIQAVNEAYLRLQQPANPLGR